MLVYYIFKPLVGHVFGPSRPPQDVPANQASLYDLWCAAQSSCQVSSRLVVADWDYCTGNSPGQARGMNIGLLRMNLAALNSRRDFYWLNSQRRKSFWTVDTSTSSNRGPKKYPTGPLPSCRGKIIGDISPSKQFRIESRSNFESHIFSAFYVFWEMEIRADGMPDRIMCGKAEGQYLMKPAGVQTRILQGSSFILDR